MEFIFTAGRDAEKIPGPQTSAGAQPSHDSRTPTAAFSPMHITSRNSPQSWEFWEDGRLPGNYVGVNIQLESAKFSVRVSPYLAPFGGRIVRWPSLSVREVGMSNERSSRFERLKT